jgi:bifunctional DNA-binding transcriptional regulator/antitoxin component of YhaV-PrlF toxin-antitoxin module
MPTKTALPVEFLATSYLGEKGQLTIPKQYRDALTLKTGAPIAALRLGNGLLLIPEDERFRKLCDRLATVFARHEVTAEDLLKTLPEARAHVFAELYPKLAEPKTAPKKARRKKR